eukprot:CAMPEP_0206437360 /NCGR_PEP_ID=MMETSP0324_2-20121206/10996_1 /ASSEMBLY_ACC=CAM_ASM_000836 /TAXON_ID=2866 /ORGANISM="Crypthecodinium cohnii, Strain Seligo" /LENGTH=32 /DNA_ID= /DNA_START= /DNA_END= /DNA_ORIENTATION=
MCTLETNSKKDESEEKQHGHRENVAVADAAPP